MSPSRMKRRTVPMALMALLLSAVIPLASPAVRDASALTVPPGFVVENVVSGASFNLPIGMAFLPDGRFLVTEQAGVAWMVENGVRLPNPVWSATDEILSNGDRGLLGVAVDPNFFQNHYVYFLYTVDPDSNGVDDNQLGFGRLTRFTMSATGDTNQVDISTRTILLGADWTRGKLDAGSSHSIGTLRWGSDGSLLVSAGEGAEFAGVDPGGLYPDAFLPGRTDPNEDIGAFRAQDITNICGKILRLDPATGAGYASNPYFDGNPFSARSRVYAYGLRNPFRFGVRPGTGSADTASGLPGTLFLGDVGWSTWEELNVATAPGQNFGWPCREGFEDRLEYQSLSPTHNGCGSVGSPTNPAAWRAPSSVWHHSTRPLSLPPGVAGVASVGGAFYTAASWPGAYRGRYFFADYGGDFIRMATFSAGNLMISATDFGTQMDAPVDIARHPSTGDLYYVAIAAGEIRRIRYTGAPEGNAPPVAHATATPLAGAAPLLVQFDGTHSFEPDGDALTYSWDFGDGGSSVLPAPAHLFSDPGTYAVVLTVDDGQGNSDGHSVAITVGVPPPFPSSAVLDDFNRPDEPLGAPWTGSLSSCAVTGNQLAQTGGFAVPIWGATTFGPDQEAFVTLDSIAPGAGDCDLILKAQGTSYSSPHLQVRYDDIAQTVVVSAYIWPAGWKDFGTFAASFLSGDRLGARAYANGTVSVFQNAALLGTASVVDWPFFDQGGQIGLTLDLPAAYRLDDFGGGDWTPINPVPQVTVQSPNGGESWVGGSAHFVLWTAIDDVGVTSVDVDYKEHAGSRWIPIARNHPNTGSFEWFVHNTPGSDVRVRVTARDASGNAGVDSSDADVAITPTPGGAVPTTLRDFQLPGTQPFGIDGLTPNATCYTCHAGYDPAVEPGHNAQGIMMSQAARDPLFYACLTIAEQDAPSSGDLCIRCHAPQAWLTGNSQPTSGARIDLAARDGVSCDFCHRLVDPIYQPGVSPPEDLIALDPLPPDLRPLSYSNGQYVVDPEQRGRGPFADADPPHAFLASTFTTRSEYCGTCHDVSNPVYHRTGGARYDPGPLDARADSITSEALMPLERTFSEWKYSAFPAGVFRPEFGGNGSRGIVSECQDCHMPAVTGAGCNNAGAPIRDNLPLHDLTGGNAWMGGVIASLYPTETNAAALADAAARAVSTLQRAAAIDIYTQATGDSFAATVRVTNRTGHKLPTGYPEGRRMWLNVQARDSNGDIVYESCGYDSTTGVLAPGPDARVYEILLGFSTRLAATLGRPPGVSFHFALNDTVYKDNRIPPYGFTNAAYDLFGARPVDPEGPIPRYPDLENWDESTYALPATAVSVTALLYYQTTSKEYVEFLRDENTTNNAGQTLYDAWTAHGRAAPVLMASRTAGTAVTAAVTPPEPEVQALRALSNPFRGTLALVLTLPASAAVRLDIFDVAGRRIGGRPEARLEAGLHQLEWDGRGVDGAPTGAGIYWAVVHLDRQRLVRRVVRLN